jgi:hypothetical protein
MFDARPEFLDHAGWFENSKLEKTVGQTGGAKLGEAGKIDEGIWIVSML